MGEYFDCYLYACASERLEMEFLRILPLPSSSTNTINDEQTLTQMTYCSRPSSSSHGTIPETHASSSSSSLICAALSSSSDLSSSMPGPSASVPPLASSVVAGMSSEILSSLLMFLVLDLRALVTRPVRTFWPFGVFLRVGGEVERSVEAAGVPALNSCFVNL